MDPFRNGLYGTHRREVGCSGECGPSNGDGSKFESQVALGGVLRPMIVNGVLTSATYRASGALRTAPPADSKTQRGGSDVDFGFGENWNLVANSVLEDDMFVSNGLAGQNPVEVVRVCVEAASQILGELGGFSESAPWIDGSLCEAHFSKAKSLWECRDRGCRSSRGNKEFVWRGRWRTKVFPKYMCLLGKAPGAQNPDCFCVDMEWFLKLFGFLVSVGLLWAGSGDLTLEYLLALFRTLLAKLGIVALLALLAALAARRGRGGLGGLGGLRGLRPIRVSM